MSEQQTIAKSSTASAANMFDFGDPETVLTNSLTDYLGVFLDSGQEFYTPPISYAGLIKLRRVNAHHESALVIKRNAVVRYYKENKVLTKAEFSKSVMEYAICGQCYYQKIFNKFNQIIRLKTLPGLNMRKMKEKDRFLMLQKDGTKIKFKKGEVIHLKEYDLMQQVYGLPNYLGGVQSALLNEDATLFRRKYYKNGAHMGFVFYVGGAMDGDDVKLLQEKMKESKGVGNFSSLFLNLPKGGKDAVQIHPIGDIATKDEFERIKNITRNDVISMHRIQPALAGIMPENKDGFGDLEKIERVYYNTEIIDMQMPFLELNNYLTGSAKIIFEQPEHLKPVMPSATKSG